MVEYDNMLVLLDSGIEREQLGMWAEAEALYRNVLAATDNTTYRRAALMSLLRVIDHSTKSYGEFRGMIENEREKCTAKQRPVYDNLLCELYVREGRYREAVDAYELLIKKYDGTATGVSGLARLAKLYGEYVGDKVKAREYADRAAAINPGLMSLAAAYKAAGLKYSPIDHENIFHSTYLIPDEETDGSSDEIVEFITNSPNPFNPATTFNFAITTPGQVRLSVYSITGQRIATLVDEPLDAGMHSAWFDGSSLSSGIYFYRFESPGFDFNGKMLLVK